MEPASPTVGMLGAEELKFLDLINQYRVDRGLSKLEVSPTLTRASLWMSGDMADQNYLSHTDSLGRGPHSRIVQFQYQGLQTWGENVAAGNSDAEATFQQWKHSPGHDRNMLDPAFKAIGIGRANNASADYHWYWTTDFAGYGE